jgi:hypothetical protein
MCPSMRDPASTRLIGVIVNTPQEERHRARSGFGTRARRRLVSQDWLQLQFGPHVQASPHLHPSPHWQPTGLAAWGCWQPQVQPGPGQDSQVQAFELAVIGSSSFGVDVAVNEEECRRTG